MTIISKTYLSLFQEEDFKWCFKRYRGFFIPVFDNKNRIQGLSIHLDKQYKDKTDIWFSSNNLINGTAAKNWCLKNNITMSNNTLLITNELLLANLLKEVYDVPLLGFQEISNTYMILKEIEKTDINNIIFVFNFSYLNKNMDYIINRIFRDLVPLHYNLDIKYVMNYRDIFRDDFLCSSKVA